VTNGAKAALRAADSSNGSGPDHAATTTTTNGASAVEAPLWRVEPQPLLGFRNAPRRTRVYLTCRLDAPTYARRWEGEDWSHVGAHHRDSIHTELWPWLLERGYASEHDAERLDPFLRALGRRFAHLRPSMHVARSWSWEEAEQLEDSGRLTGEIRDALNAVLAALEEPLLSAEGPGTADGSDRQPSTRRGKRARADRPDAPPPDDRPPRRGSPRPSRARRSTARG
jgi:hypothetical protein